MFIILGFEVSYIKNIGNSRCDLGISFAFSKYDMVPFDVNLKEEVSRHCSQTLDQLNETFQEVILKEFRPIC